MATAGSPRVLFAGGGTGGHLFPGIAVARELIRRHPDAHVSVAGTARGLETHVVPREGFILEQVRSQGIVGRSRLAKLRGLATLPLSFWDAWRILRRQRPDVVVGLGGYSSGPLVLLAAARRLPTLLLEQNAVPGVTNRMLAPVVRAAAVSFEATLPFFRGKGFVSGNPVREAFCHMPAPERRPEVVHVLVLGGSQGAHAINRAMTTEAARLSTSPRSLSVTHQTGRDDLDAVRVAYREAGVTATVEPFIDAMDAEMAKTDLVVCRAGATTLAEVVAAGRPVIVVPYPHATHDHQRRNAAVLAEAGAAEVVDEDVIDGLVTRVLALAADDPRRAQMADVGHRLARPDASSRIVDVVEEWLTGDAEG